MQKHDTPEVKRVDRSHLAEAIATLKLGLVTATEQKAATLLLIQEALMMKRALEFYANVEENYLDDVPMKAGEDGLLTIPDQGRMALWGLRRLDLQLGPAFQREEPEVTEVAAEPIVEGPVVDAEPVAEGVEPVTPLEASDGEVAQ